jgi:hypothetical protein
MGGGVGIDGMNGWGWGGVRGGHAFRCAWELVKPVVSSVVGADGKPNKSKTNQLNK